MDGLSLRPATPEDAARLYAWRMDPGTRANSLAPAAITPAEHRHWLTKNLANPTRRLYIAEGPEGPVGTGRLDLTASVRAGEWALEAAPVAEVSVTVAPEVRGQGWGTRLVAALVEAARGLGRHRLEARIKADNTPSLLVFLRNGFQPTALEAGIVRLTRRLR